MAMATSFGSTAMATSFGVDGAKADRSGRVGSTAAAAAEDGAVAGGRPEGATMPIFGIFFEKTKSHPRVLSRLSVKPSPSVRFPALGEGGFPVERFPGLSSPRVALGEGGFPECNWSIPECILHPGRPCLP
jgi:hypothetical protein